MYMLYSYFMLFGMVCSVVLKLLECSIGLIIEMKNKKVWGRFNHPLPELRTYPAVKIRGGGRQMGFLQRGKNFLIPCPMKALHRRMFYVLHTFFNHQKFYF